MMRKRIRKLSENIDSLSLRERGFMVASILVVMIMIWHAVLMEPLNEKQVQLQQELRSLEAEATVVAIDIKAVIKRSNTDPDSEEKQRIVTLEQQMNSLGARIQKYADNVVTPEQMTKLLEKILNQQVNLELVRLDSVDVEPLFKEAASDLLVKAEDIDTAVIYKHGMLIETTGSYLDVLAFLQTVEGLGWDIFWDEASITKEQYPLNKAVIRLHTISLDNAWIGV